MHEIRVDPSALWETGGVLGAAAERVDAARHGLAGLGPGGAGCGYSPAAATAEAVIGAAVPTGWAGTAARSCGDAQQRAVADCRALVRAMRSWSMRTSRPCVLPGSNRRASWRCYATTRSPTQQTWRGLQGPGER
jgi:hypothetical protein